MKICIVALVCFFASAIGSVCGIGGGVIIKPVLDALGIMDVASVSFLSGCTVLSMSVVALYGNMKHKTVFRFRKPFAWTITAGSVLGGLLGKSAFRVITGNMENKNRIGAVQAAVLLCLTAATLFYHCRKTGKTAGTGNISNTPLIFAVGAVLGILSSFLGIGGGPMNLAALTFLFSMETKEAALYSIHVILFSQTAGLCATLVTKTVPRFPAAMLFLMSGCGILGAFAGAWMNKKADNQTVDKCFAVLLFVIIAISLYNIFRYR